MTDPYVIKMINEIQGSIHLSAACTLVLAEIYKGQGNEQAYEDTKKIAFEARDAMRRLDAFK